MPLTVSSSFDFSLIEAQVSAFWEENQIYKKAKQKSSKGAPYYFLDGPPYTTGRVHIGTAWNKTMKDMFIRYKRMQGFDIWDRPGYDMHGIPTERATELAHGISGRNDIESKIGKDRFVQLCRQFCIENMNTMSQTFKQLGVWMDFDNSYQSLSKEFMEGEWWFIARAHEKGRLYKGLRTMAWDVTSGTALSKHELEYKNIVDTAVYVRLKITNMRDRITTYFIIWTTTPWTIAYNLAILVNPKLHYSKLNVVYEGEEQNWYILRDSVDDLLLKKLNLKGYKVLGNYQGQELEGMTYEHPFHRLNPIYEQMKLKHSKAFSCIADTSASTAGTGIVHCAPGCGPEDYECGYRAGLPAFNTVNESGIIENLSPFDGLRAKMDDAVFVQKLQHCRGNPTQMIYLTVVALLCTQRVTHDYPHGERSGTPVIFRTTKQWFLKIEDIKERLIEENDKIKWMPESAYNAFSNWLTNLRDNSISKQRFWGTPLPIWINTEDEEDYLIVSSARELASLAGLEEEPQDLHIDTVDPIVIRRASTKTGKMCDYRRISDVLDVWVDAGTTLWNSVRWFSSHSKDRPLTEFTPAEFILEGRDQIRGWFNLLHVLSMVVFDKPAFRNVYVHGFVNSTLGKKMSKSQGNYILPEEITGKYGVDVMRCYVIGASSPGQDMNYNPRDVDQISKNMRILWNIHKYVIDFRAHHSVQIRLLEEVRHLLGTEELYVLSHLNVTVQSITAAMEKFQLHQTPSTLSRFLMDLSKTYMQLVWERVNCGTAEEQSVVLSVMVHVLIVSFTMFSIVSPFFSEQVYRNLREDCTELRDTWLFSPISIHLHSWPTVDHSLLNTQLEVDFNVIKRAVTAILAARIKASIGVRHPVREIRFSCGKSEEGSIDRLRDVIMLRTNSKNISFEPTRSQVFVRPNLNTIGKSWGKSSAQVVHYIEQNSNVIHERIFLNEESEVKISIEGESQEVMSVDIKKHHLILEHCTEAPWVHSREGDIQAYLDTTRTDSLLHEGYGRELIRKVQLLRKKYLLDKNDLIVLTFNCNDPSVVRAAELYASHIMERTGTHRFKLKSPDGFRFAKGYKGGVYKSRHLETEKLGVDIVCGIKLRVLLSDKKVPVTQ
ncbi:Isoleucyl-tRNA synthetase [Planoprotostelium fungivorum]|uniref:isoleucine--tRNA ligase n=1 Tax=Planoprotostelium fungivorum TaxID=1890364 RepID=A0A2P6MQ60_9EUKA|nr:Isoleucyl-tRNA synthetase [Planoprotostelium fungivorum]